MSISDARRNFAYLDLARHLAPDRLVQGLQAIGADGTHSNHDSLEAMASDYADQIRALHSSGPYDLLSYSLGGMDCLYRGRPVPQKGRVHRLLYPARYGG